MIPKTGIEQAAKELAQQLDALPYEKAMQLAGFHAHYCQTQKPYKKCICTVSKNTLKIEKLIKQLAQDKADSAKQRTGVWRRVEKELMQLDIEDRLEDCIDAIQQAREEHEGPLLDLESLADEDGRRSEPFDFGNAKDGDIIVVDGVKHRLYKMVEYGSEPPQEKIDTYIMPKEKGK